MLIGFVVDATSEFKMKVGMDIWNPRKGWGKPGAKRPGKKSSGSSSKENSGEGGEQNGGEKDKGIKPDERYIKMI